MLLSAVRIVHFIWVRKILRKGEGMFAAFRLTEEETDG